MNNKGFTLIELITVLVLLGIIIIPTSNYIGLLRQYSFTKNNANNAMEVQAAISRINFELQTAFLSSIEGTDTPGETIKKALKFNNARSNNREIRETDDGIYLFDGSYAYPLLKIDSPGSATLTLDYLDTSDDTYITWTPGTTPSLKLIKITLEIDREDLDTPLVFQTDIFPRG